MTFTLMSRPQEGCPSSSALAALVKSTCVLTLLPESVLDPKSLPLDKSLQGVLGPIATPSSNTQLAGEILAERRERLANARLALYLAKSKAQKNKAKRSLRATETAIKAAQSPDMPPESPANAMQPAEPYELLRPNRTVKAEEQADTPVAAEFRHADTAGQVVPESKAAIALCTMDILYPAGYRVVRPVPAPDSPSLDFPIFEAALAGRASYTGRRPMTSAKSTSGPGNPLAAIRETSKMPTSSPPLSPKSLPLPASAEQSPKESPEVFSTPAPLPKQKSSSAPRNTVTFACYQEVAHRTSRDRRPRSHFKRSSPFYSRGRWADVSGSGFADTSGYFDASWGVERKDSDTSTTEEVLDNLREGGLDERDWVVDDFVVPRTPRNSVADGVEEKVKGEERIDEKKGFVRRKVGEGIAARCRKLARVPGEFVQMTRMFYAST